MSYDPPPPLVHPRNTTLAHSRTAMAATQLPPVGPHTFSDPAYDTHRTSRPFLPVSLDVRPVLAPIYPQARYHNYAPASEFPISRQDPISPADGSLPRKRQATVSVESLLQPRSFSPARSRSRKISLDYGEGSSQPAESDVYHVSPQQDSPVYSTVRSEDSKANQGLSLRESRLNIQPLQSPIETLHRESVSTYYSSRNSSIDYAGRPSTAPRSNEGYVPDLEPRNTSSRYRLSIRQQPIAARACGYGERDRRVIDPPPILQLKLANFDPESSADVAELKWPLNVVHCTLWSVPGQASTQPSGADVTSVPEPMNPAKLGRRLMGTLVATPFVGIDPDTPETDPENSRLGCFFIFHDLSCRQNGHYRLRFTLMHVNVELTMAGGQGSVVSSVESDTFEVFSAKDFPGMKASTPLTRDLKRQGANVQVKKGNEGKLAKKGQKRGSVESEESASNASDIDAYIAKGKLGKKKRNKP